MFTRIPRCTHKSGKQLVSLYPRQHFTTTHTPSEASNGSGRSPAAGGKRPPLPHHDLKSYIAYANQTNVNQHSTVFRGTLYEYSVQKLLGDHLGFDGLLRSGKAGDKGVDLLGNWKKLLTLIQCKSSTVKTGARLFREMAGVYNIFVDGSEDEGNALIIIASPASITSQGMKEFLQLSIPIIYCKIDFIMPSYNIKTQQYDYGGLSDGSALQSILYNREAEKLISDHGLKVDRKHTLNTSAPILATESTVRLFVSSTSS